MTQIQRPLAPHLQIYRPQITSVLSILHRITGIFLTFGLLVFVIWLAAIAGGKSSYDAFYAFCHRWESKLYLFILDFSFFYHLCNGMRHLAWDAGYGFDMRTVYRSAWTAIGISTFLALVTWFII